MNSCRDEVHLCADVGQEFDPRLPFRESRLDLSDEFVQVAHQRLRHLREFARIGRRLEALDDGRR